VLEFSQLFATAHIHCSGHLFDGKREHGFRISICPHLFAPKAWQIWHGGLYSFSGICV